MDCRDEWVAESRAVSLGGLGSLREEHHACMDGMGQSYDWHTASLRDAMVGAVAATATVSAC